jgi:hypothetical protein
MYLMGIFSQQLKQLCVAFVEIATRGYRTCPVGFIARKHNPRKSNQQSTPRQCRDGGRRDPKSPNTSKFHTPIEIIQSVMNHQHGIP